MGLHVRGVIVTFYFESNRPAVTDVDDTGILTDWWGYCWMILAEHRGLLTPEIKARARMEMEEKYLAAPNVIGVIVGR